MDRATKQLILHHINSVQQTAMARVYAESTAKEAGYSVGYLAESISGKVGVIESIHPDEHGRPLFAVRRILPLESRDGKIREFPRWNQTLEACHAIGPISLDVEFWALDQIKRRVPLQEAINE